MSGWCCLGMAVAAFPVKSAYFGGHWLLLGFLCFLGLALLSFGHDLSPVMIACWKMRQLML
jgi:hypothetical protein